VEFAAASQSATSYFPLILLALAFVLLIFLPARQRRKMQQRTQEMQDSIAIGTPVMTTSGLHGTVTRLGDTTVDLEIAPGVVATFERRAILEVRKPAGTSDVPPADENPGRTAGDAS
jgi:preprotein translocase subunit YajC